MKPSKKIAFVANTSWSVYNFRLEVAQHLKSLGYLIYVIAPRDKHSEKLIAQGFTFIEAPIKPYSSSPLDDFKYFLFLLKTYKRQKFHHIFHYTIKSNLYGSFAARIVNTDSTIIVTGLGRVLKMPTSFKKLTVHFLYKYATKSTKHLWFLNKADIAYFKKSGLTNRSDILLLPSEGVDIQKYISEQEKDYSKISFLFAGRLLKEKGIEHFIKAAEAVKTYYKYVDFDIVGFIDPKDADSINQKSLHQYHSDGVIHYHGDTEDIRPFIQKSSCVVLPSSYGEGVSRILLEAASMSTPIITTKNRGCSEVVIDGYNGFLCHKNDAVNLTAQMLSFITLDEEAKRIMGQNGRTVVSRLYDIKRVIKVYENHLNNIEKNSLKSTTLKNV